MSWNPIRAYHDSKLRKQIKENLFAVLRKNLRYSGQALDLAGIDMLGVDADGNVKETHAIALQAIEELCREHPEYSVVDFKSGVTIVLTRDVDALDDTIRAFNEKIGVIQRGGKF